MVGCKRGSVAALVGGCDARIQRLSSEGVTGGRTLGNQYPVAVFTAQARTRAYRPSRLARERGIVTMFVPGMDQEPTLLTPLA